VKIMRVPQSNVPGDNSETKLYFLRQLFVMTALLVISDITHAPTQSAAAQHAAKPAEAAIPVHFTDIRKPAGINFIQDSTGSDQ